MELEAVYRVHD